MSEQTKDKNVENNNEKIHKEYCDAQNAFQYYKSEYEWISNTGKKEAIRQIDEEAMKIRAMFNGEKTKEQAHYLKYYYGLMIKKYWVESEQYAAVLMQNMRAKIAQMRQYEIDNLDVSYKDILKSFLGLDDKIKEARKEDKILQSVRLNGLAEEISLDMQTSEQIFASLRKQGNFVGITIPEVVSEQTALVLANDSRTKAQIGFDEMVSQKLQEENLLMEDYKKLTYDENDKKEINEQNSQNKDNYEIKKEEKKPNKIVKANYEVKEKGEFDK